MGVARDGLVGVGVARGPAVGVGVTVPACWSRNDCAPVPLQVYCTSCTLSAADAAGTSRHLPLNRDTK